MLTCLINRGSACRRNTTKEELYRCCQTTGKQIKQNRFLSQRQLALGSKYICNTRGQNNRKGSAPISLQNTDKENKLAGSLQTWTLATLQQNNVNYKNLSALTETTLTGNTMEYKHDDMQPNSESYWSLLHSRTPLWTHKLIKVQLGLIGDFRLVGSVRL